MGITLQRQAAILTTQGLMEQDEWKDFVPQKPYEKELAVALTAEAQTFSLVLRVRPLLYDLFQLPNAN